MSSSALGRPIEILMVEDDPGDVRLTREALKEHKILHNFRVARTGDEALAFLRREGSHVRALRPDLILLDLNLPGRSGRDVLEAIKSDPELRLIPVVVLTSSAAEEDVVRSYRLGANCYVTKPVDFVKFGEVISAIDSFWLTVVTLPPRP